LTKREWNRCSPGVYGVTGRSRAPKPIHLGLIEVFGLLSVYARPEIHIGNRTLNCREKPRQSETHYGLRSARRALRRAVVTANHSLSQVRGVVRPKPISRSRCFERELSRIPPHYISIEDFAKICKCFRKNLCSHGMQALINKAECVRACHP
jgi:hypothetical protein